MENNMKRVYDYLKAADTYYLATVEGNQPRVRPSYNVKSKIVDFSDFFKLFYLIKQS